MVRCWIFGLTFAETCLSLVLGKYEISAVCNDSVNRQQIVHYENTPIQIYWTFYNQNQKIFR